MARFILNDLNAKVPTPTKKNNVDFLQKRSTFSFSKEANSHIFMKNKFKVDLY